MSETNMDVGEHAALFPCGSSDHEDCGLRLILDRLGEKWTVMTLAELTSGPRRYRELERALEGISQRMMTLTLRRLERDGLVVRHVEATVPPSVSYELSELGHSLATRLSELVTWSRKNKSLIEASQAEFDARG
nr:helix-turn-helix domain-containing protein [uncultured Cohaesibacter sp.]